MEFKRFTSVPLQSRFLSQTDTLSNKLLKLFEQRGGQMGLSLRFMLKDIVTPMAQVTNKHKCIINFN